MNEATIEILTAINAAFYDCQHASFSATRDAPWPGWRRCDALWDDVIDAASAGCAAEPDPAGYTVGSDPGGRAAGAASVGHAVRVLDLACGNLRFERFLAEVRPSTPMHVLAVDACDALASEALADLRCRHSAHSITYAHADLIGNARAGHLLAECPGHLPAERSGRLLVGFGAGIGTGAEVGAGAGVGARAGASVEAGAGSPEAASADDGRFDIVVSFGFMHHIPSYDLRERFLLQAVGHTAPGGVCAVSFWRFLDDTKLAARAERDHARAVEELGLASRDDVQLEPGDRIIGWQAHAGVWRYCHGFSEEGIGRLAASVSDQATLIERFDADGKSGRLNTYLVFRRVGGIADV